MRQRAEALELQAQLQRDPIQKARLLVTASELRAMLGQLGKARVAADQGSKLGNYVAQRQARQLAQAQGDVKAVSAYLSAEVHSAPTALIRGHAAITHAEFERLHHKDALAAGRSLEQAQRCSPSDPRPGLFKLARQLGSSPKPPSFKWPEDDAFHSLALATAATGQLRGDTRAKLSPASPPVAIFLDAQRALARRDRQATANALLHLRSQPGFERSVPWLCAALFAPLPNTRQQAAELLAELLRQRSTPTVRRALAARALELGDAEAATLALREPDAPEQGEPAFSEVDELSIGTLCQSDVSSLLSKLGETGTNDDALPLVHAVALCLEQTHLLPSLGSTPALVLRASYTLSEPGVDVGLAAAETAGVASREAITHPLLAALALENACQNSDAKRLAELLLGIPHGDNLKQLFSFHYAAALLLEQSGDSGAALEHYTQALRDNHCGEAALSALLDLVEPQQAIGLLEQFVARLNDDDEKQALLLAHAALISDTPDERARLCLATQTACPDHVMVEALVQRFASTSIHAEDAELESLATERAALLARRAQHSDTEFERALAHVRLVYAGQTGAAAAQQLDRAWELWPKDLGLLDLREQHIELSLEVKARAREQLAAALEPSRTRACLQLESALFYELAGLGPDAARVSGAVATDNPLAALCFARTAPGTEFAGKLREWVTEKAQTAATEDEQAQWWLVASRLASDAGAQTAERKAIMQAVVLNPKHLEALLTAESLAFREGAPSRIADIEKRLAEVLLGEALHAHAQLAARFEQLEHGWASGYAALQLCDRDEETPLQVARRLESLARRAGDHERYYRMLAVLLRRAAQPHDKAVLLLRSAEVSLHLDKPGSALTQLDDAVELAPRYTTALALRAHILAEQQYFAAAAEAYERLAFAATSRELSGEAFKQAAVLLSREALPEVRNNELGQHDTGSGSSRPPRVADPTRVKINLERALDANPDDDEVLDLLVEIYIRQDARASLDELFSRRLELTPDEQKAAIELRWSRACVALGAPDRARELVDSVLERSPEHPQALTQLVELTPEDPTTREQALLQLVRVTADPLAQSAAYKQLGYFYWHVAPQPTRALRCFHEAVKRNPGDHEAFEALIDVTLEQGALEQATAATANFAAAVRDEADERVLTLAQAKILSSQDLEKGEQCFVELLERWPFDEGALSGLVRLFQRNERTDKLDDLINDVRHAAMQQIPAGNLLTKCLASLLHVANITNDVSAKALTVAVSNFLHEQPSGLDARGSRAMSRGLDSILAPPPLGSALLSLMSHTYLAIERALPLDLETLEASELNDPRVRASFDMKAKAMGLSAPELLIVRKQPYACMVTQEPARVVLGSAWVELSSPSALDFATWRVLKLLQARLGPIAYLPAAALMSHVEALLSAYVDTSQSGLAAYHVDTLCKRLHPQLRKEAELTSIAQQALDDLDRSELSLSEAIAVWVDRCALLAVGELRAAVHGVAMLHGELPPPRAGGVVELLQRLPEASRLVASMLSPEMAEAHRTIH